VHTAGTESVAFAFQVLVHRSLSTHLLIDWDGTIYQAADVGALAYHAGRMNDSSVGVDLVSPHAQLSPSFDRPFESVAPLLAAHGHTRAVVEGSINGDRVRTFGPTEAQQTSLRALCAALAKALPRLEAAVPRDDKGRVVMRQVPDPERFSGVMAHWHVSDERWDPGPGIDWEGIVRAMRDAKRHRPRP
jgi:N-acetyl-anhydromuramyl-L-alanine amidase AmpD